MSPAAQHSAGAHGRSYGNGTILKAVRIALRFKGHTPTTQQLQDAYGMSKATAYRWRNAFLDAKGEQ